MNSSKIASKIRDIADNYNTSAEKVHSTVWEALMAIAEEIDPQTEPAPRLNVGDWATDGVLTGKITSVNGNIANVKTSNAIYVLNTENLKPIPKSEVKVTLTLEGTVEIRPANDAGFKLRYGKGLTEYALIDYAHLSPDQAELVRELVEEK